MAKEKIANWPRTAIRTNARLNDRVTPILRERSRCPLNAATIAVARSGTAVKTLRPKTMKRRRKGEKTTVPAPGANSNLRPSIMFMVDSSQPKNAQLLAREIKNKAPQTVNFTRIE